MIKVFILKLPYFNKSVIRFKILVFFCNGTGDGTNGIYNGLPMLPNESSQKASNKADSKSRQKSYHSFFNLFYIFVGFNIPALLIPFIGNFLEKLNLLTSEEAKKKTKPVKTTPWIGSAGLKGYPGPCPLVN